MSEYKVIFKNENRSWQNGCPLFIETIQASRNTETAETYLQIKVKNISNAVVGSYTIEALVTYENAEKETAKSICLDADIAAGDQHIPQAIKLQGSEVVKITAKVSEANKTSFASAKVVDLQPTLLPVFSETAKEERKAQLGRAGVNPQLLQDRHAEHEGWWLCGCGSVNMARNECHCCGATLQLLRNVDDEAILLESAKERKLRTAIEDLNAKDEAAIRRAEAALKDLGDFKTAQENLSKVPKQLEAAAAAKKRKGTIAIAAISVGVIAIIAVIVFNTVAAPYMKSREEAAQSYQTAERYMNIKNYPSAAKYFEKCGNYKDAKELAEKNYQTQYDLAMQEANEWLNSDHSDLTGIKNAHDLFNAIKTYKDSADQVKVCEAIENAFTNFHSKPKASVESLKSFPENELAAAAAKALEEKLPKSWLDFEKTKHLTDEGFEEYFGTSYTALVSKDDLSNVPFAKNVNRAFLGSKTTLVMQFGKPSMDTKAFRSTVKQWAKKQFGLTYSAKPDTWHKVFDLMSGKKSVYSTTYSGKTKNGETITIEFYRCNSDVFNVYISCG